MWLNVGDGTEIRCTWRLKTDSQCSSLQMHDVSKNFFHHCIEKLTNFLCTSVESNFYMNLCSYFEDPRKRCAGGSAGDLQRASGFRVAAPATAAPEAITPPRPPPLRIASSILPGRSDHSLQRLSSPSASTLYRRASLYVCNADRETETSPRPARRARPSLYEARGAEPQKRDEDASDDMLPVTHVFQRFLSVSIRTVTTCTATESLLVGTLCQSLKQVCFFFLVKNFKSVQIKNMHRLEIIVM